MTKWEYRIMEISKVDSRLELLSVDGKLIERSEKPRLHFYMDGVFDLYACLNAVGQEGWEMQGCSPAKGSAGEQNHIVFLIFMKRMISTD